ncbi:hypothetical protein KC352_g44375, partial [Hortaea werneckii]
GEKKFVCKGNLQSGAVWGCGRRFARADALGRHFRSEAGRVCIKPLLEEEAAERQRAWMEEQQQAQVAAGLVAPQPIVDAPQIDMNNTFLPAVLLQQYPALANIDWNAIPPSSSSQGNNGNGSSAGIEEEYSGRSSFDAASSGGEFFDDPSDNEMVPFHHANANGGASGLNNINSLNPMGLNHHQSMSGGVGGGGGGGIGGGTQGFGGPYGGTQSGDYLSDFEGR